MEAIVCLILLGIASILTYVTHVTRQNKLQNKINRKNGKYYIDRVEEIKTYIYGKERKTEKTKEAEEGIDGE